MIPAGHVAAAWFFVAVAAPARFVAQGNVAGDSLASAHRLLGEKRFSEAERLYTVVLQQLPAAASALRASASFGRAFAVQQRRSTGGDTASIASLEVALRDYEVARSLDSGAFFGAASNNRGIILRDLGRHVEAWRSFLEAAGTQHRARPYFYLNAGRECEVLATRSRSWFDSAAVAYRSAISVDSNYTEARQALLGLYGRAGRPDSVLAIGLRWSSRPELVAIVNDALVDVFANVEVGTQARESSFVVWTRNLASMGVAPRYFVGALRSSLQSAVTGLPTVRAGVGALVDAYQIREAEIPYREPAGAEWWRATAFRRAAWSSTLRSIGDWYRQAGSERVAASYYETAIGYPHGWLGEPWIDLDALLPLAVMYAHRAEHDSLDAFIEQLFGGKGGAYRDRDVRRERYFHLALGALFSERGEWGRAPWDVRGAIFQLEAMRRLTPVVAKQTGRPLRNPPELLEKLVLGYRTLDRASPAAGYRSTALEVAREARREYLGSGQNDDVARLDSLITTLERR